MHLLFSDIFEELQLDPAVPRDQNIARVIFAANLKINNDAIENLLISRQGMNMQRLQLLTYVITTEGLTTTVNALSVTVDGVVTSLANLTDAVADIRNTLNQLVNQGGQGVNPQVAGRGRGRGGRGAN